MFSEMENICVLSSISSWSTKFFVKIIFNIKPKLNQKNFCARMTNYDKGKIMSLNNIEIHFGKSKGKLIIAEVVL